MARAKHRAHFMVQHRTLARRLLIAAATVIIGLATTWSAP